MRNINSVTLTGNLTKDPELTSVGQSQVCTLRIACNGSKKNQQTGQYDDVPNYFTVKVWGNQGQSCANFLAKGKPIAVVGRLEWRSWQDNNTGQNREAVEIVAHQVQFLHNAPPGGYQGQGQQQQGYQPGFGQPPAEFDPAQFGGPAPQPQPQPQQQQVWGQPQQQAAAAQSHMPPADMSGLGPQGQPPQQGQQQPPGLPWDPSAGQPQQQGSDDDIPF